MTVTQILQIQSGSNYQDAAASIEELHWYIPGDQASPHGYNYSCLSLQGTNDCNLRTVSSVRHIQRENLFPNFSEDNICVVKNTLPRIPSFIKS